MNWELIWALLSEANWSALWSLVLNLMIGGTAVYIGVTRGGDILAKAKGVVSKGTKLFKSGGTTTDDLLLYGRKLKCFAKKSDNANKQAWIASLNEMIVDIVGAE